MRYISKQKYNASVKSLYLSQKIYHVIERFHE